MRDFRERLANELGLGVAENRAEPLVEAKETAGEVLVSDADGGILKRSAEPLLAAQQLRFGPGALGDLLLQFLGAAHGQRTGHDRNEGENGNPGDNGGEQLDKSGQAVRGPPENNSFHQVRGTAREDEGHEQPEDRGEWHVFPTQDEVSEHARDGQVGRPYSQVREDVQPAVPQRP